MTTKKLIEVKGLYKYFGDFAANKNLNFDVYKGEIFGFLGANGAGKTTAMKILCGLSKPSEGQVLIDGLNIEKDTNKIKKRIGYMSQRFSLYEDLTVGENINFFGGIYGLTNKEIKERKANLIEELNLRNQEHTLVKEIPLGWRQKLAFSIALIHKPKLIFLDEPTSGVDPLTRRDFWRQIKKMSQTGLSIFVTTHYMDEAEYCDRISLMDKGEIVELDTPENLKRKYNTSNIDDIFVKIIRGK